MCINPFMCTLLSIYEDRFHLNAHKRTHTRMKFLSTKKGRVGRGERRGGVGKLGGGSKVRTDHYGIKVAPADIKSYYNPVRAPAWPHRAPLLCWASARAGQRSSVLRMRAFLTGAPAQWRSGPKSAQHWFLAEDPRWRGTTSAAKWQ